ncbi:MAG: tRNA adenosine(34) deaminase TadA [Oscillospiraceae bacterium]
MIGEDARWMREALDEARRAAALGEIPIGAIVVQGDTIVGRGHNLRESQKNALCHAEVLAIAQACRCLGGWRLPGCTLYVTLEPCPMCAGAVINSRIERVVFGAFDPKAGSFGSLIDLSKVAYNHAPRLTGGVMEEDCAALLRDFFAALRQKRRGTADSL